MSAMNGSTENPTANLILEADLIILLTNLNNKIQKRLSGPLSAHGISVTEYLILRQLYHAPNKKLRRINLADSIGLSASGVTRLLNPMEKIGLVEKEDAPRDARVSLVALTDAGVNIFLDADRTFSEVAQTAFSALNTKEQNNLSTMMSILL